MNPSKIRCLVGFIQRGVILMYSTYIHLVWSPMSLEKENHSRQRRFLLHVHKGV